MNRFTVRDFFPIRIRGLENWYSSLSEKARTRLYDLLSWLDHILAAVALSLFLTNYVFLNCVVPTGSMTPTVSVNNHVIGLRMAYSFEDPQRGDIVMFYAPDDLAGGVHTIYLKRIIGLPGETINITAGVVRITTADGSSLTLTEDYIGDFDDSSYGSFLVPEGCYFMLGDNRANSFDSLNWVNSYVPREDILAKAWLRISRDGLNLLPHMDYGAFEAPAE